MNEKSRCSILFHLLVPGGKWHTVICKPVSSANLCSYTFHSLTRTPLLPPASAVINNCSAAGYAFRPIQRHHRRTLSTANEAVSWSTPTLTHPSFRVSSYT